MTETYQPVARARRFWRLVCAPAASSSQAASQSESESEEDEEEEAPSARPFSSTLGPASPARALRASGTRPVRSQHYKLSTC